jgi:hypothetical protein
MARDTEINKSLSEEEFEKKYIGASNNIRVNINEH